MTTPLRDMFLNDPISDVEVRRKILTVARLRGCTCDPEIDLPALTPGALAHGYVRHDDWCPLILADKEQEK